MSLKALSMAVLLAFNACDSAQVETENKLAGDWVLTNVFLGDAIDTPCGYTTKLDKTMTIQFDTKKLENESSPTFSVSGQSAVNRFFSSYSILSFDSGTGRGKIKMGVVGGTKMAGPAELMDCESRYYSFIQEAESFEVLKDGDKTLLHLGRLKEPNSAPSRDGGTYLVFEKSTTK